MTGPERPAQGEPGKTPGAMHPEEKTKPGADVNAYFTTPEKKPAEAVPSPKETEKGKPGLEKRARAQGT